MPQLDPSSFPSQLFWLSISFVVLYMVLARFLMPRVQNVFTLRKQTLDTCIADAGHMKSEAEKARDVYEAALTEARAKSQALFSQAHAAIAARAAAQQAEIEHAIEKRHADSDASIRVAKQSVMEKLSPVSGELASLIVEVLVHHKPSAKEVGAVISELAKERRL